MTIGIVGLPHYFPDGFYLNTMDKKYVVYQHVTPDGYYYFGVTQNVERRWSRNGAEYKGTALYPYIEKYGWDNIKHIVLFRDQTRENALFIENFLIETAREDGVCINKHRSGYVSKEEDYNKNHCNQYYKQNREKELKQKQDYYQKNREKRLEYQREYREENREKYNEYHREYQRQYYQRKKQEKQFKELGLPLW